MRDVRETRNKHNTIITVEPDRIEEDEKTEDRERKETGDGDKIDSKDEGDQNRWQQISQEATGTIPTGLIDFLRLKIQGQRE